MRQQEGKDQPPCFIMMEMDAQKNNSLSAVKLQFGHSRYGGTQTMFPKNHQKEMRNKMLR